MEAQQVSASQVGNTVSVLGGDEGYTQILYVRGIILPLSLIFLTLVNFT